MKTPICDLLGIDLPLLAFSHCRDVVAAVTNAGGFGVLGASMHTPEQLEHELAWIDDHVGGRPYGADILVPEKFAGKGQRLDAAALNAMIGQPQRDFVAALLESHGIEPAAGAARRTAEHDDQRRDRGAVARRRVQAPDQADRQRARHPAPVHDRRGESGRRADRGPGRRHGNTRSSRSTPASTSW